MSIEFPLKLSSANLDHLIPIRSSIAVRLGAATCHECNSGVCTLPRCKLYNQLVLLLSPCPFSSRPRTLLCTLAKLPAGLWCQCQSTHFLAQVSTTKPAPPKICLQLFCPYDACSYFLQVFRPSNASIIRWIRYCRCELRTKGEANERRVKDDSRRQGDKAPLYSLVLPYH